MINYFLLKEDKLSVRISKIELIIEISEETLWLFGNMKEEPSEKQLEKQ